MAGAATTKDDFRVYRQYVFCYENSQQEHDRLQVEDTAAYQNILR